MSKAMRLPDHSSSVMLILLVRTVAELVTTYKYNAALVYIRGCTHNKLTRRTVLNGRENNGPVPLKTVDLVSRTHREFPYSAALAPPISLKVGLAERIQITRTT